MTDSESLVVATAERVFAKFADPQTILKATDGAWAEAAWAALEEAGLPLAWVPEELGGAGAALEDGFAALRAAGRFAVALPLAETLLAGWLLATAGIPSPPGRMSVAPARPGDALALGADGRLRGSARGVPFARDAEHLAALATAEGTAVVALVRAGDCRMTPRTALAGDPLDLVDFSGALPLAVAPSGLAPEELLRMGAAARAQQIAGALQTMLEISVRHAAERVAFDRPIARFQAVQHNLARLGGEAAAAVASAVSAADTVAHEGLAGDAALLEIASAKTRAGASAEAGAAIAHQTLGAIGFTAEHVLHRFTLRALGWRDDFGDETFWSARLGAVIAARGADALWPLFASR